MQGRQGPDGEAWEKPSSPRIASLNGTGKHRTLPPRPPGTPHIDQPPTRRVARPQRKAPRNIRRALLIWGSVFIICALLACGIGYAAFNYINGINASSGPSQAAKDFLQALNDQNYEQAYSDLGVMITLNLDKTTFKQQAQSDDLCYGHVTNYSEVDGSATNTGNVWGFSYNIIRDKVPKGYQLHLQLKQDPSSPNTWRISDYGGDLGPATPGPTCK